jgi:hypothetical protein
MPKIGRERRCKDLSGEEYLSQVNPLIYLFIMLYINFLTPTIS